MNGNMSHITKKEREKKQKKTKKNDPIEGMTFLFRFGNCNVASKNTKHGRSILGMRVQ